jgi:hypothetical protein
MKFGLITRTNFSTVATVRNLTNDDKGIVDPYHY